LAELDYERGYAANDRGDSKDAEPLLQRSLDEATTIPSKQLEIRALIQLSSAESNSYHDSQAVEHAQKAIQLARDNVLEVWAANGLVRLANVQLVQGNLKDAEQPLQEALEILRQSPQPRTEALANTTLASLMDQEHHPEKVEAPAQAALNYYKKNGFSEGASKAGLLLVRTERDKGQYDEALLDGNALLALDEQHGLPAFIVQAEEAVGTIYLAMEQYPRALIHFQKAKLIAASEEVQAYQALHCGEALWKLGQYADSATMLELASKSNRIKINVGENRVESLLSQERFRPALELAQQVITANPGMAPDWKRALIQDEAIAQSHLGMKGPALAELATFRTPDQLAGNSEDLARQKLAAAEIYLWLGMSAEAHDAAAPALEYFTSTGQVDSETRSLYLLTVASKGSKDEAICQSSSKNIVDTLAKVRQDWGLGPFEQYMSRPDLRTLALRFAKTCK